jgi:hypothetical protein
VLSAYASDATVEELLEATFSVRTVQRLYNGEQLHHSLRKTNDRPDLSSERAPHRDRTATFRKYPSDGK